MATLFKTLPELQQNVTVSNALSLPTLAPFLQNSEPESEVIRVTGQAIYADLVSAYNANSMTASQTALLPYVQKPLANLALHAYVQQSGVLISTSGLTADREKQPYQYQQIKLEQSLLNTAYFSLDALIAYLFANQADFPTWKDTSEYKLTRGNFINAPTEFTKWVNIKNNYRTLVALRPFMLQVESANIKATIGADMYAVLKTEIEEGNLTEVNYNLVNEYIQPAVAHLSTARAVQELNFNITADGAFLHGIKASSNANIKEVVGPDMAQKAAYASLHENDGNAWLTRLTEYLNANASATVFPEYFASDLYQTPDAAEANWDLDEDGKIYY